MTRRRGQAGFVLTARDDEMLIFVGLMGIGVTVEHLTVAFFSGADRARRRTKQLVDAGYLDSWLVDSRASRVVTLSAQGLAYVKEAHPELAERLRRGKPVQAQALAHASAVVWARMQLAALAEQGQLVVETVRRRTMLRCATHSALWVPVSLASPTTPAQRDIVRHATVQLLRFVAPHEPQWASFGFGRFGLRPDGLAVLGPARDGAVVEANDTIVCALEVDLGSEDLGVIKSKMDRYERAYAARALDEVWLFADGGSQRLKNLAQECAVERGGLVCRVVVGRSSQGPNDAPGSFLGKPTSLATCQYADGDEGSIGSPSAKVES